MTKTRSDNGVYAYEVDCGDTGLKCLYTILTLHAQAAKMVPEGQYTCFPSLRTLAAETSSSVNTVKSRRERLRQLGLISWEERKSDSGDRDSDRYAVRFPPAACLPAKVLAAISIYADARCIKVIDTPCIKAIDTPCVKAADGGGVSIALTPNKKREEKGEETRKEKPFVPSGDGTGAGAAPTKKGKKPTKRDRYDKPYSPGFDRFWGAYPPRAGSRDKKEAWVAYQTAVDNGADPEVIISGAKQYSEEQRKLDRHHTTYVKLAATWLNKRSWEDYTAASASPLANVTPMAKRVWADVDSPQWLAWDRYFKSKGSGACETDARPDGPDTRLRRGWYFESEWPTNEWDYRPRRGSIIDALDAIPAGYEAPPPP